MANPHLYAQRRKQGRCGLCGRPNDRQDKSICSACVLKQRQARQRRMQNGLTCHDCATPVAPHKQLCPVHRREHRRATKQRYVSRMAQGTPRGRMCSDSDGLIHPHVTRSLEQTGATEPSIAPQVPSTIEHNGTHLPAVAAPATVSPQIACCGHWHAITALPFVCPSCGRLHMAEAGSVGFAQSAQARLAALEKACMTLRHTLDRLQRQRDALLEYLRLETIPPIQAATQQPQTGASR